MDPGADEEPSREELASRVDQLEQTVSKMLPDRRGVIKGLGAAAIGAGVATGGASGQSAAGQVGTESEPVDVEAAQGNFDSVSAELSFTDPAGVEHTGELADISDVGGGGGGGDIATVTVASSSSSFSADYNCDGTNDHTTINDAISSLPNGGGTVVLTAGEYDIGGAITDNAQSHVTLIGQGDATHLRVADGTQTNIIDLAGVSDWRIESLRLNGNNENQSDGGSRANQCGIFVLNCDDVILESVTIEYTVYSNFRAKGDDGDVHSGIECYNSRFHDTLGGSDKIADGHSITTRNGSSWEDCRIIGTTITDCAHQSIEWVGVQSGECNSNHVRTSKPESASQGDINAIAIHSSGTGTTESITIGNNYAEVDGGSTTLFAKGDYITVTGNIVKGGGDDMGQILIRNGVNNTVVGNTVTDGASDGGSIGIQVDGADNTVIGNVIEATSGDGIQLSDNGCTCHGNIIRGAGGNGINVTSTGCIVAGNHVTGSTSLDVADSSGSPTANRIVDNKTSDGSGEGRYVQSTAPNNPRQNDLWFDTS